MDEVRYSDGEYLVTMGEVADALFFIKSGEVRCSTWLHADCLPHLERSALFFIKSGEVHAHV
jgi:CRP-like cAMP-binding protein